MKLDLSELEHWELSALIKAMHEARFPEDENDPAVWLSPFVVELHVAAVTEQRRRVQRQLDELASRNEEPAGNEARYADNYERWARWRGRREHDVVKRRLDESSDLRRWFAGLTREDVRQLFRPFTVDDECADDLLAHAGAANSSTQPIRGDDV